MRQSVLAFTALTIGMVANTYAVTPSLLSPQSLLEETKLRTKPTIPLNKTMNFSDCLQFEMSFSGTTCPRFFIPMPAVKIEFSYQEPGAVMEAGCLRGQSMLQGAQGAGSRLLSGGIHKVDDQRCVEPLKTDHGEIRRHFNDVSIWSVSAISRFESSGTDLQVFQSLTCEIFSKMGLLTSAVNFVGNIDISNFNDLGGALKEGWSGLTDQFKEFSETLNNLPQSIQNGITDRIDGIQNRFSSIQSALNDLDGTIDAQLSRVGDRLTDLENRFASLSPTNIQDSLSNMSNDFFNSISGDYASLANYTSGLASGLEDILSLPGVASLPGAGAVATAVDRTATTGSIFSNFASVDASNLSLRDQQNLFSGIIGNGGLTLANSYDETADFLSQTFLAMDNQTNVQVASLSPVLPSGGSVQRLIQDLRTAANHLRKTHETIQSHRSVVGQMNFLVNQLGGGFKFTEITRLTNANGNLRADGFIENGGSQTMYRQAIRIYNDHVDDLIAGGEQALTWAAELAEAQEPELCRAYYDLKTSNEFIGTLSENTKQDDFVTGVYPAATYLPLGHVQYVQEGKPSASCPLTSAGYTPIPRVNGPTTNRIQHCEEVCIGPDRSDCKLVPKEGYYLPAGETCETNRLSTLREDGLYPSCNGIDGQGRYRAKNDHRQILESRRATQFRQQVTRTQQALQQSFNAVQGYMRNQGISMAACEPHRPFTIEPQTYQWRQTPTVSQPLSRVLKTQVGLSQMKPLFGTQKMSNENFEVAVASTNIMQILPDALRNTPPSTESFAGSAFSSETRFAETLRGLEEMADLLNTGALQARFANELGKFYPFGLSLGFHSPHTEWQKHRFGTEGMITTAVQNTPAGSAAWMLCSGGSLLNAMTGTDLANMQNLQNSLGCIGAWGLKVEHGWGYNKNRRKNQMLSNVRGLNVATKLKAVQPNLRGVRQFNVDFPFLYNTSSSPYTVAVAGNTGGGRHQGSGCYDEGTTNTSWYTPGEAGAPAEGLEPLNLAGAVQTAASSFNQLDPTQDAADLGGDHIVATSWKKTACEAKFDLGSIASVLAGGFPKPCDFNILY